MAQLEVRGIRAWDDWYSWRLGLGFVAVDAALFEADGLACALAEIEEFGSANDTAAFDFYLGDARRMERELTLNPLPGDDSSDRKHFASARSIASDDHTREDLDAFFFAFVDFGVNIDRVADIKFGAIFPEVRFFDVIKNFLAHRSFPYFFRATGRLSADLSAGYYFLASSGRSVDDRR